MLARDELKTLASLQAEGPILSVYLNVDPTQRTADEYKLKLRELLKSVEDEAAEADREAVKRYVESRYDWSGRGLALFSRAAEDIWHAFPLAVPVRSGATVSRRPYISPLVELDNLYGNYMVALVDQQGARFFSFKMGELVNQEEVMGEDIHHTRKGRGSSVVGMRGGSQASGRKEAELVQRNLKDTVTALANYWQRHQPRYLLLAGADPTVAKVRDLLPPALQERVAGTFNADMDTGVHDVHELALELLREFETQRQEELLDTVVTSAAKGHNGVVGLDQTLSAASEGRIQVLVVGRDYHQAGYKCDGCGYLTTQPLKTCPFCGGEFKEIRDAVEAAVSHVVEKGGEVEVMDDEFMGQARVGALLRY